jgi:hypothetical protein
VRSYFAADQFAKRYPAAHARWLEAERLLWAADAGTAFTTIGHLCREAIQETLDVLAVAEGVASVGEKSKTIARLRAILEKRPAGETASQMAEALMAYVGSLSDLVQRQEHGGAREGTPLVWEDARRVVFLTIVVLTELDRLLGDSRRPG